MFLSIFLAIAVFAQCTPTESIWDPRVKAAEGQVCHMNLALVAEIMCCKLLPPWSSILSALTDTDDFISMVCCDGLFPRFLSVVRLVEGQYQEEGKNHYLRLSKPWALVSLPLLQYCRPYSIILTI